MTFSHLAAIVAVAAGATLLLGAIVRGRRFRALLPADLRRRWLTANGLMHFFLVGYLGYVGLLASGHSATIELLNASIFLGGAVFVLLVVSLSQATLSQVRAQEVELARSHDLWRNTFDSIGDAITIHDMDFNVLRANRVAERLLELDPDRPAPVKCFQAYHGTDAPPTGCPSCTATTEGRTVETEVYEPRIAKHLLVKAFPLRDENGSRHGVVHVVRDVSERKAIEAEQERLEGQLIQAQKMEAVGRLAGGVAHDFNNILSVVLSCSELGLLDESLPAETRKYLQTILDSGERAAGLTRQLLAFSRKQVLEPKAVLLPELTENLAKMLRVMLGEDVSLELDLATVEPVLVDPGQLEQVLMNLAVNARDAMPGGGRLTVSTGAAHSSDPVLAGRREVKPGPYVRLSVADTGTGMSPEVQAQIFEPFFTTKAVGKGTGLGLATVYGIVKQHSGYIYVDSEAGRGTRFDVFLPPVTRAAREDSTIADAPVHGGRESVLVVDDEAGILELSARILRPLGYTVLTAATRDEVLAVGGNTPPDLLVTDVVLSDSNGRELAETLQARWPGLKVLYMSGYTDDVIVRHGVLEPGIAFLHKPLTPRKLADKVRATLDGPPAGVH